MGKFLDVRKVDTWVIVEIPNFNPHYFDTFEEALNSPIRGHLMTNKFYKQSYEN